MMSLGSSRYLSFGHKLGRPRALTLALSSELGGFPRMIVGANLGGFLMMSNYVYEEWETRWDRHS
jgi:hypothetical protein